VTSVASGVTAVRLRGSHARTLSYVLAVGSTARCAQDVKVGTSEASTRDQLRCRPWAKGILANGQRCRRRTPAPRSEVGWVRRPRRRGRRLRWEPPQRRLRGASAGESAEAGSGTLAATRGLLLAGRPPTSVGCGNEHREAQEPWSWPTTGVARFVANHSGSCRMADSFHRHGEGPMRSHSPGRETRWHTSAWPSPRDHSLLHGLLLVTPDRRVPFDRSRLDDLCAWSCAARQIAWRRHGEVECGGVPASGTGHRRASPGHRAVLAWRRVIGTSPRMYAFFVATLARRIDCEIFV